ncbi:MAG: baseplate J/gp47 family protein [Bacteroidota bacterium]
MISGIKPKELLFRDGTSQSQRLNNALDPDAILVDERQLADFIRFAQDFAEKLQFFNQENELAGTWEGFLIDDYTSYKRLDTESQKKELREKWLKELITYAENPEKFADNQEMIRKFARPHLALFVTFLKLLGTVQQQMNGMSKRHLDYFYRQVLGLSERKPVPDVVNVIINLADDVQDYQLEKGTLLSAGRDSLGQELIYSIDEDTMINRSQVEEIRNVYTDQKVTGLREIREANGTEPDAGLMAVMQMALGQPDPMDPLPLYKEKAASLTQLVTDLGKNDSAAITYIQEQLMLKTEDFSLIMSLDNESDDENWDDAYALLEKAFQDKVTSNRQQLLKSIYVENATKGFLNMFKYALGSPNPNDDLPFYENEAVDTNRLQLIYEELTGKDAGKSADALAYVNASLFMSKPHYEKILETYIISRDPKRTVDWNLVYSLMEMAQSDKQDFLPGLPQQTDYLNIYTIKDARETAFTAPGEEGESSVRFKTFGKQVPFVPNDQVSPAFIGLAIASPQFLLEEGLRTITMGVVFDNPSEGTTLKKLQKLTAPFAFYLSGSDEWIKAVPKSMVFGEKPIAPGQPKACIRLDVTLELSVNEKSVTTPVEPAVQPSISSGLPLLCVLLNNQEVPENTTIPYGLLKDLTVRSISVGITVSEIKKLNLQNDFSSLSYKKPFEPFGTEPAIGDSLYMTHPELCTKQLDTLSLNFEWMNPPSILPDYYATYKTLAALSPVLTTEPALITANADFKVKLSLFDKQAGIVLQDLSLFEAADAKKLNSVKVDLKKVLPAKAPGFVYEQRTPEEEPPQEIQDAERYWRFELNAPGFQDAYYSQLLTRQAMLDSKDTNKSLVLNPPYVPKLKSLTAGYTASFAIDLVETKNNSTDNRLYHLHPFGYKELPVKASTSTMNLLLPDYSREGELYLGISGLEVPQSISVLVQMAEGSADPDIEQPDILWEYLTNDQWKVLPQGSFSKDTTNGLIDTGLIVINIPADATTGDTLLGTTQTWIRASVKNNCMAIADMVSIRTQSVQAIFVDNNNSEEHLLTLLAPDSIKAPVDPVPEIKNIQQPYTSSKGKPAEQDIYFYNRVSERLRHKNRAVTMWDYERLVLDHFPEIHKVKCVPGEFLIGSESYGNVDIIVIPDIMGKLPFNPFQPKVPSDSIWHIQRYIDQRKPAYANVKVKNASFLQVKARFAVKFKDTSNMGFFTQELNESLKRYLSPWAYDEGADIVLGGKIYANMIVNFLAEQPYVDYVAGLKLFQSDDGINFTESKFLNKGENVVQADKPDIILVSAQQHEIDIVSENGYEAKDFTGIDYMKIELDFTVAD